MLPMPWNMYGAYGNHGNQFGMVWMGGNTAPQAEMRSRANTRPRQRVNVVIFVDAFFFEEASHAEA
jgi:hypothetical protein